MVQCKNQGSFVTVKASVNIVYSCIPVHVHYINFCFNLCLFSFYLIFYFVDEWKESFCVTFDTCFC
jgi:hypothetical protein